ncbi:MAG: hypothetical protein AAF743_12765 [Planctomycetota bacterium]
MRFLLLIAVLVAPLLIPAPAAAAQDASFTLFVHRFDGASHVRYAKAVRDELNTKTQFKDWYVLHKAGESLLYHGRYADRDAAGKDRAQIARIANAVGDPMFTRVMIVPMDAPDPEAPPEWNIVNTDKKWTLVIADYTGHPDRKTFAVDAVRQAREMGVEAYYFHGPNTSSVLVGAWPMRALRPQEMDDAAGGGAQNRPIVVSSVRLPDAFRKVALDENGRQMDVIQPKIEVTDPSMARAMQDYPEYALNGELVVEVVKERTGDKQYIKPSFIADIDQIRKVAGVEGQAPVPGQPQEPLIVDPNRGQRDNPLRGLD